MDSHALNSLLDYRRKLEKLTAASSNPDDHVEDASDCLIALQNFPITSDLITQSGLGYVVASVRDKFSKSDRGESVVDLTQKILVEWKNIKRSAKTVTQKVHESTKHIQDPDPLTDRKKLLLKESAKNNFVTDLETSKQAVPIGDPIDEGAIERKKVGLPPTRKSVVNIFVNIFKGAMGSIRAEKIGLDIEAEINTLHNHEASHKEYIAKAKTLSVNIKLNQNLKDQIEKHEIDFKKLVSLSPRELAAPEVKLQREQLTEIAVDARRLDWFEKHEKEIKQKLGIDPNNSWNYDNEDDRLSEPDAEPPDI